MLPSYTLWWSWEIFDHPAFKIVNLLLGYRKKKIWRGTNTKKLKDIWWKRLQITVCLSHASNLSLHSQMDYYFLSLFSQKRERERKTGMNAWMLVFAKNKLVHLFYSFLTQLKFELITKQDFIFKLGSFSCQASSSLLTSYLINLIFFLYIVKPCLKCLP